MKHIAVILPERYRGGTLRGAKNVARMLYAGSREHGTPVKVSFGYPHDSSLYSDADFADLREMGIGVRSFEIEQMEPKAVAEYYRGGFVPTRRTATRDYIVFNDGMSNFEDADFWLIISDRIRGAIPPHRPYGVVVYDYIQRYVPAIFGTGKDSPEAWKVFDNFAAAVREADFVFCTTEQTKTDCISYVGVSAGRVHVMPMEFDAIAESDFDGARSLDCEQPPYLLWTTNTTQHKNHLNVIAGLDDFFRNNADLKLEVRMSGVYTHLYTDAGKGDKFYDLDYIREVRRKLADASFLKPRLRILGNVSDSEYIEQLRKAHFILHGALYDNGTFSVIEGAWYGVPSISSDYPAMQEMSARFSVPLTFFAPRSPDSLASALSFALANRDSLVEKLPGRDALLANTFEKVAPRYWEGFHAALIASGATV